MAGISAQALTLLVRLSSLLGVLAGDLPEPIWVPLTLLALGSFGLPTFPTKGPLKLQSQCGEFLPQQTPPSNPSESLTFPV